ncbi:LytR/AlgR family response regulator transcription factor [Deminuibacter soli]|uniref:DNA-binding response regulator n=1 Tax=Deminuibacter soli TaxID=2291815 RepID=A0A3E1NQ19_9BACT|nr:LytTR family DNA-binding domain-containing protein [Deminuibacter soli]RFM29888.1 DNA-binding response regulator [Deminuibacter soli]
MIRCMVIDDEPLALELLEAYISKVPFLQLAATYTNPIEAFARLDGIDLIFSDIQMPELTGMQLVQLLKGRIKLVFTTAYSEYAVQGYEHDVIDYLVKPFSFDRFLKAAQKAQLVLQAEGTPAAMPAQPATAANDDYIFVKTSNRHVKVNIDDILMIEGLKDYIAVVTAAEKILTLQNMKFAEELLPAGRFMRVHKSYIVALDKIDAIERNRIFSGKHVIPIGDTYRQQFFDVISKRNL